MGKRRRGVAIDGWFFLDKPLGMSSALAVSRVRGLLGCEKAGHTGTLDPLATGFLCVALGEATKCVPFMMEREKTYRFKVCWGEERSTDDREGEVVSRCESRPRLAEIEECLGDFRGVVSQVPPNFSAVKVCGKRAYAMMRCGEDVELEPRDVEIRDLEIVSWSGTEENVETTELNVTCGKGMYVRALARDLGRTLGCLGYVSMLRRTGVGGLGESDMIPLESLEGLRHSLGGVLDIKSCFERGWLRGVGTVLGSVPELRVGDEEARRIASGGSVVASGRLGDVSLVQAVCRGGIVALGMVRGGYFVPRRVFSHRLCGAGQW